LVILLRLSPTELLLADSVHRKSGFTVASNASTLLSERAGTPLQRAPFMTNLAGGVSAYPT
jgi:hypothetical protein